MKKLIFCIVACSAYASFALSKDSSLSNSDSFMIIDDLYKNINGFSISEKERSTIREQGGNPTYGEITHKGAAELLSKLNLKESDVLYDLGSGVGKLVVQVGLTTPAKVVGIELSKTRHENAVAVQKEIERRNLAKKDKITFINKNINDVPLDQATVFFMCSTCFSDELMRSLTEKLGKLKKGLRVVTLRKLPEPHNFKLIELMQLPMTWSNNTNVYIYQLP
ncbi:class I SAM-dependent methyltransferase [Candidatus Dependentiae bacterium]|nr:class I SAM-dependent methyltransferase [Candidatus Dependentiae bacterium]